jgi:tetratricopeptide (TPR) repeat protein
MYQHGRNLLLVSVMCVLMACTTVSAETVDDWIAGGKSAFTAGKYEEAISFFSRALDLDAHQPVALYNRAGAYIALQKWSSARTDLERLTAVDPGDHEALWNLGRIHIQERNYDQALTKLRAAAALDKRPVYLFHTAVCYFHKGMHHSSIETCKQALAARPDEELKRGVETVLARSESIRKRTVDDIRAKYRKASVRQEWAAKKEALEREKEFKEEAKRARTDPLMSPFGRSRRAGDDFDRTSGALTGGVTRGAKGEELDESAAAKQRNFIFR